MNKIPPQQLEASGRIQSRNAELSEDSDTIQISYKKYNDKLCGVEELVRKHAIKSLKRLREVGKLTDPTGVSKILSHVPIERRGDYLALYKGIDNETTVYEDKLSKKIGRIFYFLVGRIFFVVCIRDPHLDTSK